MHAASKGASECCRSYNRWRVPLVALNGREVIPNTMGFSEAKRALFEKYLQGNLQQSTTDANIIPRSASGGVAPLSFGQQQVWLLSRLMPVDTPVYNECVTIHLLGQLHVAMFEQSFNEIIRRHEAWRTSFPMVDGYPVQIVHPPPTVTLPVVDLRHLPEAEREGEAKRLATEDAKTPFDLVRGPLLRPKLIRLGDTEHYLYLTLHHIIFDSFTLYRLLLPELHTLYKTFSSGLPSPLPPLSIQYTDHAYWQREYFTGQVFTDQLAYWKQQLENAPAALELPTDRPRPSVQTYHGSAYPIALSKRLTDSLRALSQREGITLYMTLVAAFQTMLYRYTRQDDILLGTVTGDCKHSEFQRLLGFFLNTIVLRTDLSGNPTFRELLGRVREVIISAHAHADVPFEHVVRELQPDRNLSQNPLFQVLLTLIPMSPVLPSGWDLTQMDVQTGTSKFDLSLELEDRPEGLIGRFVYNTDLFDRSTIGRMVGHWQTLLESIVANPAQHIAELPLLTEAERQLFLVEWNATQTAYPKDWCVHQLFEAQVERTPDAIAVVFEREQLTYLELNERANQLAHFLQKLGIGPEVLVGICVERSVDMVVGLLGILKAGGAYVPLDPTYPPERLAFMLEDTQTPVLVTQRWLVKTLPAHTARLVYLDSDWNTIAQEYKTNPVSRVQPTNLAYVIYTSGSTGKPKGVMIPHQGLVNYLSWCTQAYAVGEGQGSPVHSPLGFDLTITSLFSPLLVGQKVILLPEDQGIEALNTALRNEGDFSLVKLTPSHLKILSQWLPMNEAAGRARALIIGGEALFGESISFWRTYAPGTRLINEYGPTETVVGCCIYEVPAEASLSVTVPIGRPIANTQLYLLDAYLQPVPINVPGELYIGGASLARGYLNHPDLTAERFIPHPFSDEPGARLYKTGDLARYRADGNIEFLGRLDHQVKIRGFRIELGEIEAVLGLHPAVRETVVVAREDVPGDKHLVAYVVFHKEQTATVGVLQSHLMKQLPTYMVPSAFVLLEALPITSNGKVDRRALPAPQPTKRTAEETFVAPTLLGHQQLIHIWEELLDARPIGIRDNFFHLGGHSLLAAHLVARIEQDFRKKIPLSTLFAGPTIEDMANALYRQEDASSQTPLVAVQLGESRRPFFFLHGDWTGGAFYCFTIASTLGADQPFYVLEPYKVDDQHIPPTLEAMAAAHLKALRAVQPDGPYLLGGFCNGGLVVYEMARQLYAEGQRIDLLVLVNPTPPGRFRWMRDVISRIGAPIGLNLEKQSDWFLRLRHTLRHVYRYLHSSNDSRLKDFKQLIAVDPRLDSMFPAVEALRKDYVGVFTWLDSGYMPVPYPGKITFFWAKEEPSIRAEWCKVTETKEGEGYILPGTHMACVTEHIHVLAEHLSKCLSETQAAELS